MENERLYYIESLNRWVTYEEAHQYGYTLTKPEILTFYTDDLQAIQIRRDTSTGTLYDTRETVPHSWVTDIDVLGLYSRVGSITLYTADTPESYTGYVASLESDMPTHVDYSGDLTLISDLHDNFGITDHPCQIYLVQEGIALSWYDADENLYWDATKRQWQESPPSAQDIPNIYLNGPEAFVQAYTFKQNDGTEPSGQLGGGTQRLLYNNANEAYLPIIRYPITVVNENPYFEQGHLVTRDLPMGGLIRKDT